MTREGKAACAGVAAMLLAALAVLPAEAGVGKIEAIVRQMFGGSVEVSAPLTGEALKYDSVGKRWVAGNDVPSWIDVTDPAYGATGDGTTDDSTAIQSAIDAASSEGTVYFPAGDYYLGTTGLTASGNVQLVGEGVASSGDTTRGSRIIYEGTGAALSLNGVEGSGVQTLGIRVAHLVFDGLDTGSYGLKLGQAGAGNKACAARLEDLYVTGFATVGIHCVASQISEIRACFIEGNAAGILFDDTSTNTTTSVVDCRISSQTGYGARIEIGRDVRFRDCVFELNGEEGLELAIGADGDIKNVLLDHCHFEQNNDGRAGTGHAQLAATSSGAFAMESIELRMCRFGTAGTNNYHLSLHGGEFRLWFTQGENPEPSQALFAEVPAVGSSSTDITAWTDSAMGWSWGSGVTGSSYRMDGAAGLVAEYANGSDLVEAWRASPAGQFLLPDGSASATSFGWVGDGDTGPYRTAANTMVMATGGVDRWRLSSVGQVFRSSARLGWSSGASTATDDSAIVRDAAGVLRVTGGGSGGTGTMLMKARVESVTAGSGAPNVLTASESGLSIDNSGATAEAYSTLPASSGNEGTFFRLSIVDTDGARFSLPSGSDTIQMGATASSTGTGGGYVSSTTVGSSVTLELHGTVWVATELTGTWTVN